MHRFDDCAARNAAVACFSLFRVFADAPHRLRLMKKSLAFVAWKDCKAIMLSIKAIYRAENADSVLIRLEEFEAEMG